MRRLDAQHYRDEAKRCREAAAQAKDSSTREHWLEAERCWIELANKAELVTTFTAFPEKPPHFIDEGAGALDVNKEAVKPPGSPSSHLLLAGQKARAQGH
jgi:hypothetical protein